MERFCTPGRADCTLGGQWGSEGKGAAVAWLARSLQDAGRRYDLVTTNASSQAGHTAIHNNRTYVTRHLPTAPLIAPGSSVYLNAGCAIDPDVLEQEMKEFDYLDQCDGFWISPNAAVITPECVAAENRDDSPQTKIASTRKGVGEAISRKVLRSGQIARDHPFLKRYVRRIDINSRLMVGRTVLVEIPQGFGLSLNWKFYPTCTSRDCTVMQGLADAHIHPGFLGRTMMVLRTHPIRVGNLNGNSSGDCYPDQQETSWDELGVEPEITTVTKRVRRVFSWSQAQLLDAVIVNRPDAIFLSHADYVDSIDRYVASILVSANIAKLPRPAIVFSKGATTNDVQPWNGDRSNDRAR